MSSKMTLTYFDARIRGEVVRMTLAQAGVDYVDNRIKFPEWPELKKSGKIDPPFKQLPFLDLPDGTRIAQSKAIAKYIAREHGLFGNTNLENSQIDMLCEALEEMYTAAHLVVFERDEARKDQMKKKASEETIPHNMAALEKILSANNGGNGFFVGNQVTVADIFYYTTMEMVNVMSPVDMAKYPKLSGLGKRVAALPNIAAWLQKRPTSRF